jgi:hypothetical protein
VSTQANAPIFVDTGVEAPSEWQKVIEGTWHGRPSIFDRDGVHVGYEKVARASEFADGKTHYWMNTKFDGGGHLRGRLELGGMFSFGVIDSDENRIYTGPDFYGAGQPYGTFVDSNYYSQGWQADLVTWNYVIPGTDLQVYSSVCYDGWTPAIVFDGLYLRTTDHETNPETQKRIAEFMAQEERLGQMSFVTPTKQRGSWSGSVEVFGADQQLIGLSEVVIDHEPIDLIRARQHVTWTGALERSYSFERVRTGTKTLFHGPDMWGNQLAYGRCAFNAQHFTNEAVKIKGREFMLDESYRLVVNWQLFDGNALSHVVVGVLDWVGQD